MAGREHQHITLSAKTYDSLLRLLGEQLAFHEDRLARLESMRSSNAALVSLEDVEDERLRVDDLVDGVTVLVDSLAGADPALRRSLSPE